MALLREMVDHGDYPAIRSVSHTWRSSSGLLGARRLEELLTNLESSAAERSSRCEQLSVKVEQEYGRVRELLQLAG
jgi:hypothetical protein